MAELFSALCCSSRRFTRILWWICYQDDAPRLEVFSLAKEQAGAGAWAGVSIPTIVPQLQQEWQHAGKELHVMPT